MTNPYAHDRTEGEFDVPTYSVPLPGSYAAPDVAPGAAPYTSAPGWAPALRLSPESVPDTTRLGTEPRRTAVSDAGGDPVAFFRPLDADKAQRSTVEYQDADGWEETKDFPGYPIASHGATRWARNSREIPPPEPRPTSRLAPRTYTFVRPFMTGQAKMGKRDLNGIHFSMADHRRNYDALTLGMEPPRQWRNTFRLDPTPWDQGLVDMPPTNAPTVADMQEKPVTVEVAYQSRSWRL